MKGAKAYLAGVEVTLSEGWKTYWRMPGDAGVPPAFDWTGSANVASVNVLYPAPSRMHEGGAQTIGYKGSVLFPVEVVPKDPSQPVALKLNMEFGVCRDLCMPSEARLSLALQPAAMSGEPASAIKSALERVPRQQAGRRMLDPRLRQAQASLGGASPRIEIEASFPRGSHSADLFVEAPDGLYVPMTRRLPDPGSGSAALTADANDTLARFEVDLAPLGANREQLKGKTLLLTLVSEAGASEVRWTVP